MAKPLYLADTYLFSANASVTGASYDERGHYLTLDQTIFYPQGGGQPSDQGTIEVADAQYQVTSVRQVENEIRHYLASEPAKDLVAANASKLSLDKERRLLNARYHTAAHLVGNIVEMLYPALKAVKGHSFPNEAYIEFIGDYLPDEAQLQEALNAAIAADYQTTTFEMLEADFSAKFYKLPYPVPANKAFRIMQIASLSPVPCGGTHLNSTKEIGSIALGKVKAKNNTIRIAFLVS
jgi:alanyl-tRNA synthetase